MSPLWFGFLRGINLGKRQMKMAELRGAMEAQGFAAVKTILASGNVRFSTDGDASAIKALLEKTIRDAFDFDVGVVLRSETELREMLDKHPFAGIDPEADVTKHVMMFDAPLPQGLTLPSRPGHTEIARIDRRDIYLVGYKQPNGRYTEGMDDVLKPLDRALLGTARNWNTMGKLLA